MTIGKAHLVQCLCHLLSTSRATLITLVYVQGNHKEHNVVGALRHSLEQEPTSLGQEISK
jgi:hypothetical protein